ncbi:amino acid adenylation domain-containing protein [Pseudomonas typographi]|uniref:amino acid adenylation domain-containing protein n=1 Tax=Pseudomonas typographi TaxID=2715964 RepID=UPI00168278BC|nr:amino acid adenylation domain-containing protein [Pseudomonas typographi]MBD1550107.1 amino acid adenylation domain-containing protein [Pseudomonas typographi]MBD1585489.1 amino acid adenylation domain-containing protein [Pseudomonas typographi]
MKRLNILALGHSQLLTALAEELLEHGHAVLLYRRASLDIASQGPQDLLVEDGSLALSPAQWRDLADAPRLELRLAKPAQDGPPSIPTLLLLWAGTHRRTLPASPPASPHGHAQHPQWLHEWVDSLALWVSGLARGDAPLPGQAGGPDTAGVPMTHLDALLYQHAFNGAHRPDLLAQAAEPLARRLANSLQQHAGRPALQVAGERLSYAELHRLCEGIRRCLPPRPSEGPWVIALSLPRCTALYAGVLAIITAGAVYLPIDPALPLQRQRLMLEDAGASLLLHSGQSTAHDGLCPAIVITGCKPAMAAMAPPASDVGEACMYLYTSGTTGRPKGVALSGYNVGHFAAWYADYVGLDALCRVLQFSTISFDSSLIDLFPTWLSGAELVVPDEDQRRDPAALVQLIGQQALTHGFLPPALLSLLPLAHPLGLRHITTGGDVCEPRVIAALAGDCALHNLYGPTEATVLITARRFSPGSPNYSLGSAIANSQVLILDEAGGPVGHGQRGELYIAGPGVALGYVGQSQLTAERYVTLALPDGQRLRAYRSGDLARWGEDGIELCGRLDQQVKIRGFRVEPEEIERCLQSTQAAPQVAVVIDAGKRILVFHTGDASAEAALRAQAQAQLPHYMQPLAYVALATLPTASNGKVERTALLALPVHVPGAVDHVQPANPTETQLVALWADLLGLPPEEISTSASFFQLGGHSILLSRLLLAIREQFGRSVPINRFIEQPSVLRLAQLLSAERSPQGQAGRLAEIEADIHRPFGFAVLPQRTAVTSGRVIVSGANGFLGVHIVQALLDNGAEEVACLVRAAGDSAAAARMRQACADNRLEGMDFSRLRVLAADLRQPLLGLGEAAYHDLARRFGAFIHNAANVNHVLDYASLRADNVEPLEQCLALCETHCKKVFTYISTLSACSAVNAQGQVLEAAAADTPPIYLRNGYNLSKWAAERRLERARERGTWANVIRPGNIGFNSLTGVCQPQRNRLLLMLKGSFQLGQVPAFELNFDLMPVDFLARFVAWQAARYSAQHCVFNLHNPEPLSWLEYVQAWREAGVHFDVVPVAQWQRQLASLGSDNSLYEVVGFYLDGLEEDIGDISRIAHDGTRAALAQMGTAYPAKNAALLQRGCAYLQTIGFITPAEKEHHHAT